MWLSIVDFLGLRRVQTKEKRRPLHNRPISHQLLTKVLAGDSLSSRRALLWVKQTSSQAFPTFFFTLPLMREQPVLVVSVGGKGRSIVVAVRTSAIAAMLVFSRSDGAQDLPRPSFLCSLHLWQ